MSAPKHVGMKSMEFPYTVGYAELHDICVHWHGGQWSAMYSVSSTGTIHDIDTLRGLSVELMQACKLSHLGTCPDEEEMRSWEKWCDDQIDMIDAANGEL